VSAEPTLQARLDEITARTRALVPPERLAQTDRAVSDLLATGLEDQILSPGDPAPAFTLTDAATGKLVRSSDLLSLGSLVVKFFRGRWDPYCMTELEVWQGILPEFRCRGALVVAISPQQQRQNAFAVEQHHLTFPLLTDAGCALATAFRCAYEVPEPNRQMYRSILVNLPFLNGSTTPWRLPLPATFLLSREGRVVFSEAFADHRSRTDPEAVLDALSAM
jgi:peroxiredoxin